MDNNLPAVIQTAITNQKIDVSKVNLLIPTKTYGQIISEYEKVVLEIVEIDTSPRSKEVYDQGKEKALTKVGLDKLALAACIEWVPEHMDITFSDDMKSIAKATGRIKHPNGKWITCTDTKTIDCKVYEEQQYITYEEKSLQGDQNSVKEWGVSKSGKKYPKSFHPWKSEKDRLAWIELQVKKTVLQKRQFKDDLAMTGAKNRVIRYFFALHGTYTIDELQKPFVVPHVMLDTDAMLSDPTMRNTAIQNMTGAVKNIFESTEEPGMKNVTPETTQIIEGPPEDMPPSFSPTEKPDTNPVSNLKNKIAHKMAVNRQYIDEGFFGECTAYLEQNQDANNLQNLKQVEIQLDKHIAYYKDKEEAQDDR